jgi:hypothetical protein
MSNTENLTAAQREAREEELWVAQSASDDAFFEANPLSFEFADNPNPDWLVKGSLEPPTDEQEFELGLLGLAHLFHQAATDVLLSSKFPEQRDWLVGRAYRHATLALMQLNGQFHDADRELKQRLGIDA